MKISINSSDRGLAESSREIVRLFIRDTDFVSDDSSYDSGVKIELSWDINNESVYGEALLVHGSVSVLKKIDEKPIQGTEIYNQGKRLAKLALLKCLEEFTGNEPGPWGILTGIRPVKIVHRLLDACWIGQDIVKHLMDGYAVAREKAELLLEVAQYQRKYLMTADEAKSLVSIYIGIPFCPTRCAYCSFPAYPIKKWGYLTQPFVEAINKEIEETGRFLKNTGKSAQTIYIGGGTPTSLDVELLGVLLKSVKTNLVDGNTVEYTVEAGRPDTVNKEKLEMMLRFGVNRLSINPQTMNPVTLKKIGRDHSPEEINDAYQMARKTGFKNINMDLIIGLPGETGEKVRDTLNIISRLDPENITVHTLAVKRASHIKENIQEFSLAEADEINAILDMTTDFARGKGYHPYYLYRQKQMVSPRENIGFAKDGFDCIYNINIIEERQTIIGLGAGAASKFVRPVDWTLESLYNPKDPENYIKRVDELVQRKVDKLRQFGYNG